MLFHVEMTVNVPPDMDVARLEKSEGSGESDVAGSASQRNMAAYLASGIGTAASAQLFSTLPKLRWGCQLLGRLLFKDDIAATRPVYRDFQLVVSQGPGFGVTLDEDKLAHYRRDRS